jgi:hypothetical protein
MMLYIHSCAISDVSIVPPSLQLIRRATDRVGRGEGKKVVG